MDAKITRYRIIAFLVTSYLVLFTIACLESSLKPIIEIREFNIDSKKIYFKREIRGLNYNISAISSNEKKTLDFDSDYIFSIDEATFFYKAYNDTLLIVAYHIGKEPIFFDSSIKVIQRKIVNQEYREFLENYKSLGYNKF